MPLGGVQCTEIDALEALPEFRCLLVQWRLRQQVSWDIGLKVLRGQKYGFKSQYLGYWETFLWRLGFEKF